MPRTSTVVAAALAPVVAVGAAAVAYAITGGHRRQGVSDSEVRLSLPGDEILPDAPVQNDRAISIAAPPESVWPWIAQLGQDRAGFYSFEALENLVGSQIRNADSIVPEWQQPRVGDPFPLAPEVVLRLAIVEPGYALVASSEGGQSRAKIGMDFTWAFVVTPDGAAGTRLHVRERYAVSPATRVLTEGLSMVSAFMSARMLATIKRLAEQTPAPAAAP